MKQSVKYITAFGLTLLAVSSVLAISSFDSKIINGGSAEGVAYSIVLDKADAFTGSTKTYNTKAGTNIAFRASGNTDKKDYLTSLSAGGFISNVTPLNGINDFIVDYSTSSLKAYFGWGETQADMIWSAVVTKAGSNANYIINNGEIIRPTYIMFKNETSTPVDISKITIKFDCVPGVEPVEAIEFPSLDSIKQNVKNATSITIGPARDLQDLDTTKLTAVGGLTNSTLKCYVDADGNYYFISNCSSMNVTLPSSVSGTFKNLPTPTFTAHCSYTETTFTNTVAEEENVVVPTEEKMEETHVEIVTNEDTGSQEIKVVDSNNEDTGLVIVPENGYTTSGSSDGYQVTGFTGDTKTVIIPEGVTTMESWRNAFNGSINESADQIETIVISSTVTCLPVSIFNNLPNLKTLIIKAQTIQFGFVNNCPKLKSVFIFDTCVKIDGQAFNQAKCSTDLLICCEADEKPSGWSSDWNRIQWGSGKKMYDVLWSQAY